MWYFRKMRWIVDSGGTKSSWVNEKGITKNFLGINPNIHSKDFIVSVLSDVVEALNLAGNDDIVWYGAGCSTISSIRKLRSCFEELRIEKIEIHHDLLAACRAVLGSQAGIVGILGTGSNACLYDGKNIVKEKVSLGYAMGDEGGGAYFGKRILQDYINGVMPPEEETIFQQHFPDEKPQLVTSFYSSQAPSSHLGQFAKLMAEFNEHSEYKKNLLESGFEAYKALFIKPLMQAGITKIGFVGSVASIYKNELSRLCQNIGLEVVSVCQNPIQNLLEWHNQQNSKRG